MSKCQILKADPEKKKAFRKRFLQDSWRYRFLCFTDKSFLHLTWISPLILVLSKIVSHAFYWHTPIQQYEIVAMIITTIGFAIAFLAGRWLLHVLVDSMRPGMFTQDNRDEEVEIYEDGHVVYRHKGRRGSAVIEETVSVTDVQVAEDLQCVLFKGDVSVAKLRSNGFDALPSKRDLVLYNYFTPDLIQSVISELGLVPKSLPRAETN